MTKEKKIEAVILPKEQYDELLTQVKQNNELLIQLRKDPDEVLLTNAGFCDYLKISKRTSQSYRDKRLVKFSQIGNQIFYKMSDIQDFLDNHVVRSVRT